MAVVVFRASSQSTAQPRARSLSCRLAEALHIIWFIGGCRSAGPRALNVGLRLGFQVAAEVLSPARQSCILAQLSAGLRGRNMSNDPIKHVVLLALENHSFDQMLGSLKTVYPELEGVSPAGPRTNIDSEGTGDPQAPTGSGK